MRDGFTTERLLGVSALQVSVDFEAVQYCAIPCSCDNLHSGCMKVMMSCMKVMMSLSSEGK